MCGGSPLFWHNDFLFMSVVVHFMSGRIHRENYFIYSRSPLSEPETRSVLARVQINVGENTQERRYFIYSRSPLCKFVFFYFRSVFCFTVVGENTQGEDFNLTLVLPL